MSNEESKSGQYYAYAFLPLPQRELAEAIETCMKERGLNREEAIHYICGNCDGKTLAKLADEYNYVKYTLELDAFQLEDEREKERAEYRNFVKTLNKLRKEGKITAEYRRDLDTQWRKTPQKQPWLLQHLKELNKGNS